MSHIFHQEECPQIITFQFFVKANRSEWPYWLEIIKRQVNGEIEEAQFAGDAIDTVTNNGIVSILTHSTE